jgi:hypothetical protein
VQQQELGPDLEKLQEKPLSQLRLRLIGRGSMESLLVAIGDIKGVTSVQVTPLQPAKE